MKAGLECDKVKFLSPAMAKHDRERLKQLLREKSLIRGNVVLSSGQKSNYYFDCKLTTLDPEGAFLTGQAVLDLLDSMGVIPDAIGGLTMGADPIVSATVVASHLTKRPLPGFLIRMQPKTHGMGKQIEGIGGDRRRVVIVDEVCTTGNSTKQAIDIAKQKGHEVAAVISLVDRQEGGSEWLRREYNYGSVFTASELMDEREPSGETDDKASRTARPQSPVRD